GPPRSPPPAPGSAPRAADGAARSPPPAAGPSAAAARGPSPSPAPSSRDLEYHSTSLLSRLGCGRRRPRPRRHRARRERRARKQRAALEEQTQLAQRQRPHGRDRAIRCPQRRKPPLLEPLVVHAEPGPVPQQHLRPRAPPIDEEEAVAAER